MNCVAFAVIFGSYRLWQVNECVSSIQIMKFNSNYPCLRANVVFCLIYESFCEYKLKVACQITIFFFKRLNEQCHWIAVMVGGCIRCVGDSRDMIVSIKLLHCEPSICSDTTPYCYDRHRHNGKWKVFDNTKISVSPPVFDANKTILLLLFIPLKRPFYLRCSILTQIRRKCQNFHIICHAIYGVTNFGRFGWGVYISSVSHPFALIPNSRFRIIAVFMTQHLYISLIFITMKFSIFRTHSRQFLIASNTILFIRISNLMEIDSHRWRTAAQNVNWINHVSTICEDRYWHHSDILMLFSK